MKKHIVALFPFPWYLSLVGTWIVVTALFFAALLIQSAMSLLVPFNFSTAFAAYGGFLLLLIRPQEFPGYNRGSVRRQSYFETVIGVVHPCHTAQIRLVGELGVDQLQMARDRRPKPAPHGPNAKKWRPETGACQPNPRKFGFSHTGKYHPGDPTAWLTRQSRRTGLAPRIPYSQGNLQVFDIFSGIFM